MVNPIEQLRVFFRLESAGGILLVIAALVAIVAANSPLDVYYEAALRTRLSIQVGSVGLDKPLLLWINDGLMAVFFFLVGLELKREAIEGELAKPKRVTLPLACALGGFFTPAAIYAAFNGGDAVAMTGWAIPAATDIAFSLGVLSLFGSRVPLALKVFLASLAIFDDVAAIIVIALFYATDLSTLSLSIAALCCALLFAMNRAGVTHKGVYTIVGIVLWLSVLKSGVHATLSGVVLALAIPMTRPEGGSPLHEIEQALHPWVAYLILPSFAFANAGVPLSGIEAPTAYSGVPLGIAVGLFVGKQAGVLATAWLLVRMRLAELPGGAGWGTFYGVAVLTGIGFTMSLFIGTLAFGEGSDGLGALTRLGVLIGSLASAIVGYVVLHVTLPRDRGGDSGDRSYMSG
jgi:NhaA family Na+:H+ antiporter